MLIERLLMLLAKVWYLLAVNVMSRNKYSNLTMDVMHLYLSPNAAIQNSGLNVGGVEMLLLPEFISTQITLRGSDKPKKHSFHCNSL